ncbi:MAG: hypothetical protein JKY20_05255 [Alphaproteobacteria bacterium]|nr:hypothetical protein [Alphaproteobacteria bacterium]
MSRLDTVIARLNAQRSCLNAAVAMLGDLPGDILELGLGNGRTYDHLRGLFPNRNIYVFDREVASHPSCRPPENRLFLDAMAETLVKATAQLGATAALIHADIGFGDADATERNVAAIAPLLPGLLCAGGVVFCDQNLDRIKAFSPIEMPSDIPADRYFGYIQQTAILGI